MRVEVTMHDPDHYAGGTKTQLRHLGNLPEWSTDVGKGDGGSWLPNRQGHRFQDGPNMGQLTNSPIFEYGAILDEKEPKDTKSEESANGGKNL